MNLITSSVGLNNLILLILMAKIKRLLDLSFVHKKREVEYFYLTKYEKKKIESYHLYTFLIIFIKHTIILSMCISRPSYVVKTHLPSTKLLAVVLNVLTSEESFDLLI